MISLNEIKLLEGINKEDVLEILDILQEDFIQDRDTEYLLTENEDLYKWGCETGASKIAILYDDLVFKKTLTGKANEDMENFEPIDCDYARTEYLLYQYSIFWKIEKFFAPVEELVDDVYVQKKMERIGNMSLSIRDYFFNREYERTGEYVNLDNDVVVKEYLRFKNETEEFIDQNDLYSIPEGFLLRAMEDGATVEELTNLSGFLTFFDINDLHNNNIGEIDGRLVFFDYCGYLSNTATIVGDSID